MLSPIAWQKAILSTFIFWRRKNTMSLPTPMRDTIITCGSIEEYWHESVCLYAPVIAARAFSVNLE